MDKNMDKVILWEPYKDPILPSKKHHPLDGDGDDAYFNQFNDGDDDDEGESEGATFPQLGNKFIMTELGPLGVNKRALMTDKVSMWLCHTNFTITDKDLWKVSKINGVEILKPLSRYKALVGFCSLFDCEIVKKKITEYMGKTKVPYYKLDKLAKDKYKDRHYAILSNNNETTELIYEIVGGNTIKDVDDKISDMGEGWQICKKC